MPATIQAIFFRLFSSYAVIYKGQSIQKYNVACLRVPKTWSLTLAEELKPREFENKVLTEVFECKERGSNRTPKRIAE